MVGVVIAAGGSGSRMNLGYNKVFAELGGEAIIARTLSAFEANEDVSVVAVVTGNPQTGSVDSDSEQLRSIISEHGFEKVRHIVPGGETRMESVEAGLTALEPAPDDIILIHDGGRPFVSARIIQDVVAGAVEHGAAVCGVRPKDSIHILDDSGSFVVDTTNRDQLIAVHTPVGARFELLQQARKRAREGGYLNEPGYEDAAILSKAGSQVLFVESEYENMKITTPEDMPLAEVILKAGARK